MSEIAEPSPYDGVMGMGGDPKAKGRREKGPRSRFGWARRALVAVMVVSLAVGAYAWIQILPGAFDGLTKTPLTTPGSDEMHLTTGRYVVFELTGSQTNGGPITFTQNNFPVLTPGDVTVTGPSGQTVATRFLSSNQTINRNGKIYTGVIAFNIADAGQYTVTVARVPGEVIVTRSILDGQGGHLILGIASGLVFAFAAAALLIATIVVSSRRSRARRAAWSAPMPPAYPPMPGYPPMPAYEPMPPAIPPPPPPYRAPGT